MDASPEASVTTVPPHQDQKLADTPDESFHAPVHWLVPGLRATEAPATGVPAESVTRTASVKFVGTVRSSDRDPLRSSWSTV